MDLAKDPIANGDKQGIFSKIDYDAITNNRNPWRFATGAPADKIAP